MLTKISGSVNRAVTNHYFWLVVNDRFFSLTVSTFFFLNNCIYLYICLNLLSLSKSNNWFSASLQRERQSDLNSFKTNWMHTLVKHVSRGQDFSLWFCRSRTWRRVIKMMVAGMTIGEKHWRMGRHLCKR